MKRIVLTGGGTAGHVTPNIALIPKLKKLGYDIHYIGSENGMERELIEKTGIPYHPISAGKLRRYLDLKNLTDTFRVMKGYTDSLVVLRKLKPDIVFSKGGFVSCPVVWAAWSRRIPVVIHESDITPGLANRLSIPFAKTVCYTFPETDNHLPKDKGVLTGIPVRENLYSGKASIGKKLCGFNDKNPVVVVIGGSQGSGTLNTTVRGILNSTRGRFQICHICGKGNLEASLNGIEGYKQFEYVNDELPHIFAMADLFISRAGATVLFELLALKKPNILIPLSKQASRGDQILNAKSFEKQGFSLVIEEENLRPEGLEKAMEQVYATSQRYIKSMNSSRASGGIDEIIRVIKNNIK